MGQVTARADASYRRGEEHDQNLMQAGKLPHGFATSLHYAVTVNILEESLMSFLTQIREWSQKRKLREMLMDPRSARGYRSTGQLEKGINADRSTTERLLMSIGARKADSAEEWTLKSAEGKA
jgi:hypothetical protein